MTLCIEIKGSEAIFAVASLDDQTLTHVALATRKSPLKTTMKPPTSKPSPPR